MSQRGFAIYDRHDLHHLDKSRRRIEALEDSSTYRTSVTGALIALAIFAMFLPGTFWALKS